MQFFKAVESLKNLKKKQKAHSAKYFVHKFSEKLLKAIPATGTFLASFSIIKKIY